MVEVTYHWYLSEAWANFHIVWCQDQYEIFPSLIERSRIRLLKPIIPMDCPDFLHYSNCIQTWCRRLWQDTQIQKQMFSWFGCLPSFPWQVFKLSDGSYASPLLLGTLAILRGAFQSVPVLIRAKLGDNEKISFEQNFVWSAVMAISITLCVVPFGKSGIW